MSPYQYRKSHCRDKTILRPSYLHNGISYTGETASLYWIGAQVSILLTHRVVYWDSISNVLYATAFTLYLAKAIPDSKVHGANMGSIWGREDPGGPHKICSLPQQNAWRLHMKRRVVIMPTLSPHVIIRTSPGAISGNNSWHHTNFRCSVCV